MAMAMTMTLVTKDLSGESILFLSVGSRLTPKQKSRKVQLMVNQFLFLLRPQIFYLLDLSLQPDFTSLFSDCSDLSYVVNAYLSKQHGSRHVYTEFLSSPSIPRIHPLP